MAAIGSTFRATTGEMLSADTGRAPKCLARTRYNRPRQFLSTRLPVTGHSASPLTRTPHSDFTNRLPGVQTPAIEAIETELRSERPGAILTNLIVISEFFDPEDQMRTIVVMGSGADGSPITPWLAHGMLTVAASTGIVTSFSEVTDDEDEEEYDE